MRTTNLEEFVRKKKKNLIRINQLRNLFLIKCWKLEQEKGKKKFNWNIIGEFFENIENSTRLILIWILGDRSILTCQLKFQLSFESIALTKFAITRSAITRPQVYRKIFHHG